jgi:hypothetical protein
VVSNPLNRVIECAGIAIHDNSCGEGISHGRYEHYDRATQKAGAP